MVWGEAPNRWPEDVVKAQIHVDGPSGVTEVRFSYRTPPGQQAPLLVMLQGHYAQATFGSLRIDDYLGGRTLGTRVSTA